MPNRSDYDAERLRHLLQAQHQVITRVQALACGMPQSTLDRYIAPGGRWQRLLPGVYLAVTGTATQDQRELAALLYAGRRSLLTGSAAMRRHRLRPAGPDVVDVLIPWQRRRQSTGVRPGAPDQADAGTAVCHGRYPLCQGPARGGGRGSRPDPL